MKHVIGLMSGTSLDGVDAAEIITDGSEITEMGAGYFVPYPNHFQEKLYHLCQQAYQWDQPDWSNPRVIEIARELTDYHCQAVAGLIDKTGRTPDLIGFHGQTIAHHPASLQRAKQKKHAPWTMQIGKPEILSQQFDCQVVYDFRSEDVAAGGEGAPLVPIFHQALFQQGADTQPKACVNIGGVANITVMNAMSGSEENDLIAFDTGPGNARLNEWCQQHFNQAYDRDGIFSAQGQVDYSLCDQWLEHPYFKRPYPKSLDRQDLAYPGLSDLSPVDGAATLCAFIAGAIAKAIEMSPWDLKQLIVTGGGRHNPTLMRLLQDKCPLSVEKIEKMGHNGDLLEAQAFAYLAARKLAVLPSSFPKTTSVSKPMIIGRICDRNNLDLTEVVN